MGASYPRHYGLHCWDTVVGIVMYYIPVDHWVAFAYCNHHDFGPPFDVVTFGLDRDQAHFPLPNCSIRGRRQVVAKTVSGNTYIMYYYLSERRSTK